MAEQADLSLTWLQNPKDRFSRDVVQLDPSGQVHLSFTFILNGFLYAKGLDPEKRMHSAASSLGLYRLLGTNEFFVEQIDLNNVSHITRKPVFGGLRPDKTEIGLLSFRD